MSTTNPTPNRYPATCADCGATVAADAGTIEPNPAARGKRGRWIVRCRPCFDKADHSGPEDRCCGDRAYEDACAQACGL